jgi:hypothetical protein
MESTFNFMGEMGLGICEYFAIWLAIRFISIFSTYENTEISYYEDSLLYDFFASFKFLYQ